MNIDSWVVVGKVDSFPDINAELVSAHRGSVRKVRLPYPVTRLRLPLGQALQYVKHHAAGFQYLPRLHLHHLLDDQLVRVEPQWDANIPLATPQLFSGFMYGSPFHRLSAGFLQ